MVADSCGNGGWDLLFEYKKKNNESTLEASSIAQFTTDHIVEACSHSLHTINPEVILENNLILILCNDWILILVFLFAFYSCVW